jgi:signal transduction histidine kinase
MKNEYVHSDFHGRMFISIAGLGLSLAKAIARAHGGEITVVSRLHEGSVFTVTLPSSGKDAPA